MATARASGAGGGGAGQTEPCHPGRPRERGAEGSGPSPRTRNPDGLWPPKGCSLRVGSFFQKPSGEGRLLWTHPVPAHFPTPEAGGLPRGIRGLSSDSAFWGCHETTAETLRLSFPQVPVWTGRETALPWELVPGRWVWGVGETSTLFPPVLSGDDNTDFPRLPRAVWESL